ncbi:MAG TPA: extracellular solute-binding protein [Chloroflexota bacterium]|nr:extracellular solute-binding protein [Chloroflexota bacterium]
MNRRTLLHTLTALSGTAIPAFVFTACGPEQSAPTKPAVGEVTLLEWEASLEGLPTDTVLKNFQAKNSTIKFTFDTLGQNYEEKMRTLLAAGTPYDVHRVNDDYVRGNGVKGLMTDLMPYVKRDKVKREELWEFIFDFPVHEGKMWGWGSGNQPRVMFINKTLFQNKGVQAPLFDRWDPPGWTWDDMSAAAQKLTDLSNVERPTFGVNFYEDTGYEQTLLVNWGIDEGIYSKDGKKWMMATPKGIEAIQAAIDLNCRLKVQRPFNHREGGAGVSGNTLFTQGRLAMNYATMTSMRNFRRDIKDFDWDIAPVPKKERRVTEGSIIAYCVPKDSKNPDGAWQVLQHMTSQDSGRIFGADWFYIPANKAAATATIVPKAGEKPDRVKLFVESMTQYNTLPSFTSNTERARQIYRPELNAKAYICTEPAKQTIESVKRQVEDSLIGQY